MKANSNGIVTEMKWTQLERAEDFFEEVMFLTRSESSAMAPSS